MQLHRLKLVNFRLHADTDVVFGPGLTAVVGPNGAGKTTLLEAIAWAFYGNPAARGSRDSVRRSNANARAPVRVEVEFSLGAHEYRVVRSLYSAELYQDAGQAPVTKSHQTVSSRMAQLLGMTRTEFFNTYFTGQKELTVMASLGPTDRAKFLSRLMGYERLRQAQELLRAKRSTVRAELSGLEHGLEDAEALAREYEEARERVASAEQTRADLETALAADRVTLAELKPRWERVQTQRETVRTLTAQREVARQQLVDVGREVERLTEEVAAADRARTELRDLEPQLARSQALHEEMARLDREAQAAGQRRALTGQIQEIAEQVARVDTRITEAGDPAEAVTRAKKVLDESQATLAEVRRREEQLRTSWVRDRQDAKTKRETLRDQYKDIQRHREELGAEGPEGRCPTCARPLGDEFHSVLDELGRQLEEVASSGKFFKQRFEQLADAPPELQEVERDQVTMTRRVDDVVRELAGAEAALKRHEEARAEHDRLCARRAELEAQRKSLPERYDADRHDEVRAAIRAEDTTRRQLAELQVRAERWEELTRRAEEANQKAQALEERVRSLGESIDEAGYTEAGYTTVKTEYETLDNRIRQMELEATAARGDAKAAQSALTGIERRRAEHAAKTAETARVRSVLSLHEELDAAFESLRAELNGRLRPDLSDLASAFLTELTDGRYSELDLDDQYRLTIVEDGVPKPVISGGEEDVANLVLRIAISHMVAERAGQPLSLLVLDEIFGGLDDDRRQGVIDLLRGLAGRFPQVILITHIESVRHGVDRVLRVTVNTEAQTATVVEEDEPVTHENAAA